MKLSVETYISRERFGDYKAAELIKNAGFDALDYSFYWNSNASTVLGSDYIEYAKKYREHIDALGIECNQSHAPFDMYPNDVLDASNENYLAVTRAIESAGIMGAKAIVVHALKELYIKEADMDELNRRFYKSLEPYCEKYSIKIAIENLFTRDQKRKRLRGIYDTPERLCGFIESLHSDRFVACVDLGHSSITGTEPEDFISGMNPKYLKALHVQDTDYLDDRHVLPYMGDMNWDNITRALAEAGYDGDLTLEVNKFFNRIPTEFLPEALSYAEKTGRLLIKKINGAKR